MALPDQIIAAESGGDPNAKNPNSSASGLGQFIDSTWLSMLSQHRPDLTEGKSRADLLALKSDPTLSKAMVDAYAGDNTKVLAGAGLPATPATLYLAHFAGPQGAVSLLKAAPDARAVDILGSAAASANPFLKGMTVADLQRWAAGKVGDQASVPSSAPVPAPMGMLNTAALSPTASTSPMGSPLAAAPSIPSAQPAAPQRAAEAPLLEPMAFRHLPMTASVRSRLLTNLLTPART